MNKTTHPIEPEELMAYLDGELSRERAAFAESHLSACEECQKVARRFGDVSSALRVWRVPNHDGPLAPQAKEMLEESRLGLRRIAQSVRGLRFVWTPRWVPVGLAALAVAVYLGRLALTGFYTPDTLFKRTEAVQLIGPESGLTSDASRVGGGGGGGDRDKVLVSERSMSAQLTNKAERKSDTALMPIAPMIIRTAQLSLITKDFGKARESVESILKRHHGYIGELKVGGSTGSGRSLTGTLRVPADQLDATIADLKPLGRIETESQSGQDVTSQYVDLQARLANSRNTEQRLTDLLRNRTGKLSDVLEVEQEIDRVRGEIEQMEAERKNMSSQVSYATLNLTVTEDYKAQLEVVPPSTSTRLSNAAVEGYRSVVDGALSATLFLLSTGPSLLIWGLILFFPARFLWKKARGLAH